MNKKIIDRRKFLGQASCLALGSTTLLSTLNNLKFINAASMNNSNVIGGDDYKALICILLSGGSDSHNMLIPREENRYAEYAQTRNAIAIPRDQLHILDNTNYGVHPSMRNIAQLYKDQKLSFISNIGTLVRPLQKTEVWNNEQYLPVGLFSHSDQIQQWQTSIPQERSTVGWGGKIADLMSDMNMNDKISMNISMAGNNIFQTGVNSVEYALDLENGAIPINGYRDSAQPDMFEMARNKAMDNLLDIHHQDIFKKTYVDVIKRSRDANAQFNEAINGVPYLGDLFSNDDFSLALHMICRTIAAREKLGMRRQIFFVEFDGWDHHDELLNSQSEMLQVLDDGLKSLHDGLQRLNIWDCVSAFTCSEFGRTLTWNGNGTDHAWAGNVMVMGGPVNGAQIFGDMPSLELDSDLELGGGGIMLPTLSVDEYFAELALWFGVSASDLITLFPNINNFYSPSSTEAPIGFMMS